MKNNIKPMGHLLYLCMIFMMVGCRVEDFSNDYDIRLPVSKIIDFNPKTAEVGKEITLYGEHLDLVSNVAIGSATCAIVSKEEDKLVLTVSRAAEMGTISITNSYKRNFESTEQFVPVYPAVTITQWPKEIERGQTIQFKGTNVDMIQSVKFENIALSKASASETVATFATANLTLPETGILTVVSRTGQTLTSAAIAVVEPTDTYIPEASLMLFDFDQVDPVLVAGGATGSFTTGKNKSTIKPFFGNYYSVIAAQGNGWDAIYQKLETTNNGQGFDLSSYKRPYITFLVNTNGKQGYVNPAITIDGAEKDFHFTGQDGEYKDDYKISTSGWEWRSYDLEKIGFTNIKSKVSKIALWARGGNVKGDPFEINIDQVMITDGPLNPLLIFDFESMPIYNGGSAGLNAGTGISVFPQGEKYLTVKDANVSAWGNKGNTQKKNNDGMKFSVNKTFYVNFLVNTGSDNASGYFQLIFEQSGGTKLGQHFKGSNVYGDDYKFANTGGKWQWRSYKIDPKGMEYWGANEVRELDLALPFDLTVDFSTGNVTGKYETNLDYVILTSVPLDTYKK